MSAQKARLAQLQVVSPCTSDWTQMSGADWKRHCAQCNKSVYDFAQMRQQEVAAIVAAHHGSLCARLTRGADGSLLTYEPPPDSASIKRRTSPVAAAVMAAVLGLSAPVAAQTARPGATAQRAQEDQRAQSKAPPGELVSSLTGIVTDPTGAVVGNAAVTLINTSSGEERLTRSSAEGEYSFAQVASGSYTLNVESPGFRKFQIVDVALTNAQERRLNAELQVGEVVMLGAVVAQPQPLRTLYQRSELIAIVEVGPTTVGDMSWLKTHLLVATLLKGTPPKQGIYLHHVEVDAEEREFVSGDRLLVFLNRRRDERDKLLDGYESSDWGFGIKKLDETTLGAYRARIAELAALLQDGQPASAELIEWLVSCVEDPATRAEGARELAEIVARQPDCQEGADCAPQLDQVTATEAPATSRRHPLLRAKEAELDDTAHLAAALTPEHKQRLGDALFKTAALRESDLPLISLAQQWNDARLAPFLVAQLRRIAPEAPYLAESLIAILAEVMNDVEVKLLADDYAANAVYDDQSLAANEELEEGAVAEAEAEPGEETMTDEEPVDVIAKAQRHARLAKLLALLERKLVPR